MPQLKELSSGYFTDGKNLYFKTPFKKNNIAWCIWIDEEDNELHLDGWEEDYRQFYHVPLSRIQQLAEEIAREEEDD